jgi:hypothetical protein
MLGWQALLKPFEWTADRGPPARGEDAREPKTKPVPTATIECMDSPYRTFAPSAPIAASLLGSGRITGKPHLTAVVPTGVARSPPEGLTPGTARENLLLTVFQWLFHESILAVFNPAAALVIYSREAARSLGTIHELLGDPHYHFVYLPRA